LDRTSHSPSHSFQSDSIILKMKFSIVVLAAVAALVSASPTPFDKITGVMSRSNFMKRQGSSGKGKSKGASSGLGGGGGGSTKNELIQGSCKKITLIFARASTEPGNMGSSMGSITCSGLKKTYSNDVACQGVGKTVGRGYSAGLADNVMPKGTSESAITEATAMFTQANTKCPKSIIVAGGYSQGTAVMMNTISKLPAGLKNKVVATVLFGYTKNKASKGGIPNYPSERVKVYCSKNDGVCGNTLSVTAGHFSYMADGSGPQSLAFLKEHIDKALKGVGSPDAAAPAAEAPEAAAPAAGAPAAEAPSDERKS